MLRSCNYNYPQSRIARELRHDCVRHRMFSASKYLSFHYPCQDRVFAGFNELKGCNFLRRRLYPLCNTFPGARNVAYPDTQKQKFEGTRVSSGFKHQYHVKTVDFPNKNGSFFGGKNERKLAPVLRDLESANDVEGILVSVFARLAARDQTVILKEQKSLEKVVKVFEFFKSREDYVPNLVHYNVVLRALGKAKKWDELRLCWIDMAKNGVQPDDCTYGTLVHVYGEAGLVVEALLWIKHMRLRGIFPGEITMNTVIKVLKEAGEFDRADKFYKNWRFGRVDLDSLELDSVMESGNGSGSAPVSFRHFLLTELFKTGGKNPAPKTVSSSCEDKLARKPRLTSTYNTLIDLYGKAGRLRDAADVFSEMLKNRVPMDAITFNTMIFICGSQGHFAEAEMLLRKMEERNISPDAKTYNIFLSVYAYAGNIDAAVRYYQKIREVGFFPDIVSHRLIFGMLCERNMVREVEAVLEEMEEYPAHIDDCLPVIIKMYVDEGLHDRAKGLLDKIQCDSLSSKIRAAIIDVYAEKGLSAEAEAVFYGKRDSVGTRDLLEYNVLIKAYGKGKLYDKAFSLFKGMKNNGIGPDNCTYNSLIQMSAGADLVDDARKLLAEMQRAGFKPDCQTFSSVIACHARLGQLSFAVDVYQEMVRAGAKPNVVVFGSLIDGFAERGEVEEALKYFLRMQQLGIAANQIVLTSLFKVYSRLRSYVGAKHLYERLNSMESGPDVVASTSMIGLCADLGMVSEAEYIFNNLKNRGLADVVSYATMMYLYKNMGKLDQAIDVAEEMKQSGFLRDCSSYNKAMTCHITYGQMLQCGELLHEMIDQKILLNRRTFKLLFILLEKRKVPMEAIMQLESSYLAGKRFAREAVIASAFSSLGLHAFALESSETFMNAEVGLDSFAYNVAMYVYGSSGEIDKALSILTKMQDEGLEPDIVTSVNLIRCYGKAGIAGGVKRVYSQLKDWKIKPSNSLLRVVMDAYRDANRRDLARAVQQDMRRSLDWEQNSDSENQELSGTELEEVSHSEWQEHSDSEEQDIFDSEWQEHSDSEEQEIYLKCKFLVTAILLPPPSHKISFHDTNCTLLCL